MLGDCYFFFSKAVIYLFISFFIFWIYDIFTEDRFSEPIKPLQSPPPHVDIIERVGNSENPKDELLKLSQAGDLLVLVYSPVCIFCKRFMPIWYKIESNNFKKLEFSTKDYRKISLNLKVETVPSLFKIKMGMIKKYEGKRTEADILEWMK